MILNIFMILNNDKLIFILTYCIILLYYYNYIILINIIIIGMLNKIIWRRLTCYLFLYFIS